MDTLLRGDGDIGVLVCVCSVASVVFSVEKLIPTCSIIVFSCVFVTLWCNGHVDAVQGAAGGSGPRATASSTAAAVHAVFTGATQTVELTASRVLARFLRPTSELDAKVVLGELLEDLHTVVHLPEWPSAAEYGECCVLTQ